MQMDRLHYLLEAYKNAPEEFQATQYWRTHEPEILKQIQRLEPNQLRSGKYPVFATFGFQEDIYSDHPYMHWLKKAAHVFIRKYALRNRSLLPYNLSLGDIRQMAYHTCELTAEQCGAKPLSSIEVSSFGNPPDLFEVDSKKYTMQFMNQYLCYCFAQKYVQFRGDEVVVELGSGSGHQVEILKKLYPDLTVLCFDLPAQIFLCETYLSQSLDEGTVIGAADTLNWTDLSKLKRGHVHLFGSWKFPLLRTFEFELFWNASSFGEMEPEIVKNYLGYLLGNMKWVYLLQARHGRELAGPIQVRNATRFEDYNRMLKGYHLLEERDAYAANRKYVESGGYFEAVWTKKRN
jgi:putative sugar O-methyltransferase